MAAADPVHKTVAQFLAAGVPFGFIAQIPNRLGEMVVNLPELLRLYHPHGICRFHGTADLLTHTTAAPFQ